MEFDMVQFGASIVSGILKKGGLVVAAASLPGIVTMFGSLSVGRAVPGLYRRSSRGVKAGPFCMGPSGPLQEGTGPLPCSEMLGPSVLSLLRGRWLAIKARA